MLLVVHILIFLIAATLFVFALKRWDKVEHYIAIIWKNVGKPYWVHKFTITIRKIVLNYFGLIASISVGNPLLQWIFGVEIIKEGITYRTLFGIDTNSIDLYSFLAIVCATIITALMIILDYKIEIKKRKRWKKTLVVMYAAQIANDMPLLNYEMACNAIEEGYEPSDGSPMRIPIEIEYSDSKASTFWKEEDERLIKTVKNKLMPYLQTSKVQHISLFALAPMPLLVRLGTLLNEKFSVEAYQKHRNPDNWNRLSEVTDNYIIHQPNDISKQPVLVFSLSDNIINRIKALYDGNASIWEVTVPNPNMDMMRTLEQQVRFRELVRNLLNEITHASDFKEINIHMAVPVTCAIELGRVWMPKAHYSLRLFDYSNGIENETITIKNE